ncbi:GNAT family N-acetyltransferase [Microlunatus endophyticus]|uniref:GNAT family N-acetyltransferase n=1 Tax=Microlunatus endophyticus TaxID=1716077 RepID=UPI003570FF29
MATRALGLVLDRARQLGLDSVLLTCDSDNLAAARTIERCGGRLEDGGGDLPTDAALVRRYWIQL